MYFISMKHYSLFLILSILLFIAACATEDPVSTSTESSSSIISEVDTNQTPLSSSSVAPPPPVSSETEVPLTSSSSISTPAPTSSSSNTPVSSSSIDLPYYSSGIFCFTEGCEKDLSSSSVAPPPSSSSVAPPQIPTVNDGIMTDLRDGNTYTVETYSGKLWMVHNLNYNTDKSYCYEGSSSNCDIHGRLYEFNAAQNACPTGWHLATRSDFEEVQNDPSFIWNYSGRKSGSSYDFLNGMGFHWVLGNPSSDDKSNCDEDCGLIFVQKNPSSDYEDKDKPLFFQKDSKSKGFSVRCVQN